MWDLPLRLFHWGFALCVILSFISVKAGNLELHFWFAYGATVLLVFRLVWGFVGGRTARFCQFIKGPSKVLAYLKEPTGGPQYGHNPLGALSVVAILLLVGVQLVLGVFANDDLLTNGPWAHFVTNETSRTLTHLHKFVGNVLIPLWFIAHMVALIVHKRKGHRLVPAMITGGVTPATEPPLQDHAALRIKALVILLGAVLVVWWAVNL